VNDSESKRILLVTTHLGGGGAERHLVRLANELSRRMEVAVGVARSGGSYERFLDANVKLKTLGLRFVNRYTTPSCVTGVRNLRKLIFSYRPTWVLSFLEPATWMVKKATEYLVERPILIAGVQNNFRSDLKKSSGLSGMMNLSYRQALLNMDHIVAISKGVSTSVIEDYPQLTSRISVIYNAAVESDSYESKENLKISEPTEIKSVPRLVACGRLVPQKGFDDLLKAMAIIIKQRACHLTILGKGPLLAELQSLTQQLNIEKHITFAGFHSNPLDFFSESDIFILSSRWEGFGNVVVEAMSVGLPVISTDCPFGPNEIITDGINGFLVSVGAPQQIADRVIYLLNNPKLAAEVAEKARHRSRDFSSDKIADCYYALLQELSVKRKCP
jgi:glycosyltransferase involved in cell wall biosynthesis